VLMCVVITATMVMLLRIFEPKLTTFMTVCLVLQTAEPF
jgi:hypothetical protein